MNILRISLLCVTVAILAAVIVAFYAFHGGRFYIGAAALVVIIAGLGAVRVLSARMDSADELASRDRG